MLIGGIEAGRYGKLTRAALARGLGLNGSITPVTHQLEKIRGNKYTLTNTLALTEEEAEKQLYDEILVDLLGPLRVDALFYDLSRELDENCATIAKKGCEMSHSAFTKNTPTLTAASNALCKIWYQSRSIFGECTVRHLTSLLCNSCTILVQLP